MSQDVLGLHAGVLASSKGVRASIWVVFPANITDFFSQVLLAPTPTPKQNCVSNLHTMNAPWATRYTEYGR